MVFANLFTSLSAVEDKGADIQLAPTRRNASDQGRRGEPVKRKACKQQQRGPFPKKQRYQDGKPRTNQSAGYDFTTQSHNIPKTDGTCQSFPFGKHAWHNRKDNFDGSVCQNSKSSNKGNGKMGKMQANKKFDRHNNQEARRKTHRPRFMNNDGNRKRDYQAIQERPRFMTQEFKDQNALEVDGQLLCRHFLWGKCIKGDDCQLKHVQGYNDLIKLSCKFYIQGFCLKGESCPYMHNSFPCRFFHRGARCLQEANCRFSHDPLTDATSKLLDEAIKRDRDMNEQAKAAEQRTAGSSVDTEQWDTLDTNKPPDLFLQPPRPNFYKSSEDDTTVEESLTSQTDSLKCELTLDSDKPQQVDSVEAHSPPVAKPVSPQPVCYSVEAVLGPQRFKPSTHLFTFPGSKEFAPLSTSSTSNPTSQTQALYSVDTVLNSFKSVDGSNLGLTRAPYTPTVSFTPLKTGDDACPPKNSQAPFLAKEKNETQEKGLTSFTVSNDLISNSWTKPSQAHRDQKQQHRDGWMSSNSTQSCAYKVELDNASNDIKSSASFTSEGVGFVKQAEKSSTLSRQFSKFSIPTADSQSSLKSFSSKFAQIKNTSASGAGCNTPLAKCSDSATTDKNTPTRLFQSLFKTPLTENLLPAADSISSLSPHSSAVSSCPASKSTRCQSEHFKPQDKAVAAASSLSFSAAPAVAASAPLSAGNPAGSLEVHRCSNQDKSNLLQAKAEEKSPNPKARRQTSHECANQPPEHQLKPRKMAALSDDTQKQLSDVSSHKEAAPVKSVLKTLFLCLSPFQQDYGNSATSASERKDQSNSQVVVQRRQTESRENGAQKSQTETDTVGKQSTEETPDGHRERETSRRLPRTSAEARGRPTVSSPAGPDGQARHPGTHSSPLPSYTRATPHAPPHIGPAEKSLAERAACANTAAGTTLFRNLFKTFDAATSHTAQ